MGRTNVLFVCVHNSGRSQIAEAFLQKLHGDCFSAASAGLNPGPVNPLVVAVMQEVGIDLSRKRSQGVFQLFKTGALFSYVISCCDETNAERCPVFPGYAQRIHWSFRDPANLSGTQEEQLEQTRHIRDQIHTVVDAWARAVRKEHLEKVESFT